MPTTASGDHSKQLKPLSCTSCRQRKVKCDKSDPCGACQRSSIGCVFPNRLRLPRGRQGGAKPKTAELANRLSRLESLIKKYEQAGNGNILDLPAEDPSSPATNQSSGSSPPTSEGQSKDSVENMQPNKVTVKKEPAAGDTTRFLSSDFWTNLNDEVYSTFPLLMIFHLLHIYYL